MSKLWLRLFFSTVVAVTGWGILVPDNAAASAVPGITTQPQSQSVVAGSNAVFTVEASGQGTLDYQWSRNGTNLTDSAHISGATNATLTVSNVLAGDAGNYRVVVSNRHGSVTSSNATLTVLIPATITGEPANQSVLLTSNVTFRATVSGTSPFSYQWYFNGVPLADGVRVSGSATTNLIISNVQTNDAGYYQIVATNNYGSATSAVVTLTVLIPPSILIQPASQTVHIDGTATFSVTATGTAPLNYQWYFGRSAISDNGQISGSTTNVLNILDVQPANAGNYQVVVTNNYGMVTSVVATLQATNQVFYVNLNNPNPTPPFSSWAEAATNIQDAIDAANPGDQILVTNGIYQTGGRVVYGSLTNRVAVTKPLTVQSVNGPAVTVIQGNGLVGSNAVRCVYMTNDATLAGFTLTNGTTWFYSGDSREQNGGGVWCETNSAVVTNCVLVGNWAYRSYGGGAFSGTLDHCVLRANSAALGGGAYQSTLKNCMLIENTALPGGSGGGALECNLSNCTLSGNSANDGGGAFSGMLVNCTLTNNSAADGGGATGSTLNNCTLTGNSTWANGVGGGAYSCLLNNCALIGNSAGVGGGVSQGTLNNCTLTGNFASGGGAGADSATMNNCIVYYNHALFGPNYIDSTLNYCCTVPMPVGTGNITNAPQLANTSHLSASSPCRGAGNATYATGVDIDGEPWANPPSIGCDEFYSGAVTGALNVAILASHTNVATGFGVHFMALIDGRPSLSRWDFGDGTVMTNRPYASHSWSATGPHVVTLTAYNESFPAGISATLTINVVREVHYVALNCANPAWPYISWASAATNIQDAVDAASVPGALILVSNGVYNTGGQVAINTVTNRVAVTKPLVLKSLNGPGVTMIEGNEPGGSGWMCCVYLTNDSVLAGFTLTNGWAPNGGGVSCDSHGAEVTNCVVTGNAAYYTGGGVIWARLDNCVLSGNSAPNGGGAYECILNDCLLLNNSADDGGGVEDATLNNCTLTGNSAGLGGGARFSTLNNCIAYYNTAFGGSNWTNSILNYSCTTPLPTNGLGNITNEPIFVSPAAGNFRLQTNSPCINAGNDAYVVGSVDLDGRPRIVGGTVDMGAYEFQGPGIGEFIGWLQQYGLPTDGSVDYADLDGTAFNVYQDWIAGLNPTNALSVLAMLPPMPTNNPVGLVVSWESVSNRTYFLQSSTNLGAQSAFSTIQSNIIGQPDVTSFMDTNAVGNGPFFYRVGVQ